AVAVMKGGPLVGGGVVVITADGNFFAAFGEAGEEGAARGWISLAGAHGHIGPVEVLGIGSERTAVVLPPGPDGSVAGHGGGVVIGGGDGRHPRERNGAHRDLLRIRGHEGGAGLVLVCVAPAPAPAIHLQRTA